MFEGIGGQKATEPLDEKHLLIGVYLLDEAEGVRIRVDDIRVEALGQDEFYLYLTTALNTLQRLHRYVELGIMLPSLVKEFGNDPEKRSSELQARVQAAEEDRRDEGPDRAPAG